MEDDSWNTLLSQSTECFPYEQKMQDGGNCGCAADYYTLNLNTPQTPENDPTSFFSPSFDGEIPPIHFEEEQDDLSVLILESPTSTSSSSSSSSYSPPSSPTDMSPTGGSTIISGTPPPGHIFEFEDPFSVDSTSANDNGVEPMEVDNDVYLPNDYYPSNLNALQKLRQQKQSELVAVERQLASFQQQMTYVPPPQQQQQQTRYPVSQVSFEDPATPAPRQQHHDAPPTYHQHQHNKLHQLAQQQPPCVDSFSPPDHQSLEQRKKKKLKEQTYQTLYYSVLRGDMRLVRSEHIKVALITDLAGEIYFLKVNEKIKKPPQVGHKFRSYTDSHYTSFDRDHPIICKVKQFPAEEPDMIWRMYHFYVGNKRTRKRKATVVEPQQQNHQQHVFANANNTMNFEAFASVPFKKSKRN